MFVQALAANQWVSIAILAVFFVLMIVMTIIPQRKRKKEYQDLMSNLSVGDKVMTIGRLIGKIYAIDDTANKLRSTSAPTKAKPLSSSTKTQSQPLSTAKINPRPKKNPKSPISASIRNITTSPLTTLQRRKAPTTSPSATPKT